MKTDRQFFVRESQSGFTALELLALIALLLVMALIFVPTVTGPPVRRNGVRQLSNGRAIYQSILASNMEITFHPSDPLANGGGFPVPGSEWHGGSSTSYFRYLMEPDVDMIYQEFSLFAAPGVPQAMSLEAFGPENNMWSVVVAGPKVPDYTPYLLSRNVNESVLKDWTPDQDARLERVGTRGGDSAYTTPFDRSRIVVIRFGGGGGVLSREHHKWSNLNPSSETHSVLNP